MDSYSGQVSVRHPVIAREDLDALKRGQTPAQVAETGKPLVIPPKGWREGARVRTKIVREILAGAPEMAMALTIVSLLPRSKEIDYRDDGERYSANRQDMLHLRREYATGDSHDADDLPDPFTGALTAGLEGFSEDGREIRDRRLALFSLSEMEWQDLGTVFSELIARHCVDIPAIGGPGASPEAIALAELSADYVRHTSQGLGSADWFAMYPRDTLEAMAEASGAEAARRGREVKADRKKDRAAQVAKHTPESWVPIEARFLTLEQARAAETEALTSRSGDQSENSPERDPSRSGDQSEKETADA